MSLYEDVEFYWQQSSDLQCEIPFLRTFHQIRGYKWIFNVEDKDATSIDSISIPAQIAIVNMHIVTV